MAESVFRDLVIQQGLSENFHIESAGTAGYHIGENPDRRTIEVLRKNGISEYSKSRQVTRQDFYDFDFILAMDHANLVDLESLQPDDSQAELSLFRTYDSSFGDGIVPDPYYGNIEDFWTVYEIVLRCSQGFMTHLENH